MFNHPAFKRLPKKLTISFPLWIIYATKGEYSPYYDIDKLMVENVERGFNCIRIDSGAGLIHDLEGNLRKSFYLSSYFDGELDKVPRQQNMLGDGGECNLLSRLIETFESAKRHGVYVILSQWYFLHTYWFHAKDDPLCDEMFSIPVKERFPAFAKFWHYILLELEKRGLDSQLAFVELFNEVSCCPYLCGERGWGDAVCMNEEEASFFKKQHEEALAFLQSEHPQILFAYDTTKSSPQDKKEHQPQNAQVYNFHSYYLMSIYYAVADEHPEWFSDKYTIEQVKSTRDGRRPITETWYKWVTQYNNLKKECVEDFEKALAEKFAKEKETFADKARRELKFALSAAEGKIPIVFGEGVTYICSKDLQWEEKSEEYWDFVKQRIGEYKAAGLWGTVIRTCCAPEDPCWYLCRDKLLEINNFFLND